MIPKSTVTKYQFNPKFAILLKQLSELCPNMAYNNDIDYILHHVHE